MPCILIRKGRAESRVSLGNTSLILFLAGPRQIVFEGFEAHFKERKNGPAYSAQLGNSCRLTWKSLPQRQGEGTLISRETAPCPEKKKARRGASLATLLEHS
ncbi:hypothetical protein FHS83_001391 [Rhizomicrobium palustre]|uniref:Uncharacterized protein n=1 Tax=Rhizomicrobium palustre TaxID=189966 RepID=A0A846MXP5_9PROT|nr:hypothetical protein [Rhizomicrobium palustre]